ncbi:M42 family peptidase [Rhodohalobacter sp. SW132]|uniref:M20/M25/M40 family metallo-hydrolase n=1 Tax=Rhodohalobacter sp. SW132 TaxID=2293433 RepID=UPI000E2332A5|nr:M20/M25/M40 family metallo-hydrolase [Rhodohalobacter sp. SW132]REL33658.1 M42 family peptidase [Rhodohalobacter sp. SW132]
MFDKSTSKFLEELLITPSPTGYESAGQKIWLDYLSQFSDKVESDAYGSGIAKIETSSDVMTVMLEAHADEIGMVVQYVSDDGFIYLNKLGGSDSTIARAKRVVIHGKHGKVSGVVGNTAIHLQDKKNGGGKEPAWKDIYVDIGASDREEVLEVVQIGDPVTYADDVEYLNDRIITARALDNRIGGFAIAQTMKYLKERNKDLAVNVIALNSVQEEVGGFGARMMSYRHMPDAAIVTDVTHATDSPGIDQKEHGQVKLGKGPTVQHGGANHPAVVKLIEKTAEKRDISLQHEATSVRTGTDTDSIFFQRTGIPSALVSVPIRYMHSPVETASLDDLEKLIELMAESVLSMEPDQAFTVL